MKLLEILEETLTVVLNLMNGTYQEVLPGVNASSFFIYSLHKNQFIQCP